MKVPAQPPPSVAHTTTHRKLPAIDWPSMAMASTNRPPTSIARRPIRSDSEPPTAEAMPHEVAVKDTRFATRPTLTPRSWLISIRNGARVVPLDVAAKDPRQAAPIRAHGMVR